MSGMNKSHTVGHFGDGPFQSITCSDIIPITKRKHSKT